ncbi:SDR family oxidoreductase [Streptomyces sp. NBC_01387]|uniref:SDR family NAD(P)-dependent oxidoreductase n=1 Tax=unclassified Streptomyces TaxID=2593676 RepID=UPI002025B34A|nr:MULTISPECIES: SDR family oxidoreductase [unclassified Streptomyces]MCX4553354.1 SDR family oxidoreductase [Streptomyces sp. NBC_01500]WSC18317.1 SDR family oxidoreductase [Streptomyces sp. NBC_01766]WSV52359.1 SDR family oxidoreductase [Streptomyces sp. NBC_01014]
MLIVDGHSEVSLGITKALQECGDRVAVTYSGPDAPVGPDLSVPCDVTDESQIDGALALVEQCHGPVDIIIASIDLSCDLMLRDDRFVSVADNGIIGTFRLIRRAMPGLRASGQGRIIFLRASGQDGLSARQFGSTSEAALRGFVSQMSRDEALHGITCNVVTLNSPLGRRVSARSAARTASAWHPSVDSALLAAAAKNVKLLASPDADGVNGEYIGVESRLLMVS